MAVRLLELLKNNKIQNIIIWVVIAYWGTPGSIVLIFLTFSVFGIFWGCIYTASIALISIYAITCAWDKLKDYHGHLKK